MYREPDYDPLPISGSLSDAYDADDDLQALLRRYSPEETFSPEWGDAACRALSLEPLEPRDEALAALGAWRLDRRGVHALLCLAARMASSFTRPLSFDGADDGLGAAAAQLVEAGLAEGDAEGRLRLTVAAARAFFSGAAGVARYDAIAAYASVVVPREIAPRRLYYPTATERSAAGLRRVLSPDGYARACGILRRRNRHAALTALLYGPPGTGKTEFARQLARTSGRTLVLADVAKMTSSGWGETEKGYRGLFREYAYLAAVCPVTPVLLFNEADQVLARRIADVRYSIDKSENAVADILLQEMEDMDGILIATTNLAGGIDPAFERRFLFKISVPGPDAAARERIWRDLLPSASDTDIRGLARDYALSGGQIANVAARMDLAEICGEDAGSISLTRSLCEEETASGMGGGRHRKIGF